jgi:hypothetical protein
VVGLVCWCTLNCGFSLPEMHKTTPLLLSTSCDCYSPKRKPWLHHLMLVF